jgi:hypothetical protein
MRHLALAALAATWACTPSFEGQEIVRDLRILAVQAEPPEAAIDLSTGKSAPVQVRVLSVDPAPRAALAASGSLCFPTDSGRCDQVLSVPIGPAQMVADEGPSWILQVSPAIAQAAVQEDDLKGFGGVRVQLSLSVSDGDPHGPVFAEKLLLFSPPGGTVNHNPGIASLELTDDGAPAGTVLPGDRPSWAVGVPIGILPHLAPGEGGAETYTTTDLQGNAVTLTETPRYSFFALPGADLDTSTADEPLPGSKPPKGLVRLTPLQRGPGTLWIVVRDGRGGVGWLAVDYEVN